MGNDIAIIEPQKTKERKLNYGIRNISYYKLSEMSGVSTSTLENIIKGHTKNPGIATIHQLALGFNMTIAEFCDFDEMNMYEFVEEENEVAG
ncbi:helix-turn-helix domain-containing protein [Holdemania filiformis]|uniref:helix-turn-helix domain-containing protein n=1 Tax=Holdemania filiformis TaxID=61171 RepID=UPI00266F2143|nr:helix-turn-helix transcriptional regulator [Holdemania filiformis]